MGFILVMWDRFNIWKSISVIHHAHRLKEKKHVIILTDVKNFDKIQC